MERETQAVSDERYAAPAALLDRSSGASGRHLLRGMAPTAPKSTRTDITEEIDPPSLLLAGPRLTPCQLAQPAGLPV